MTADERMALLAGVPLFASVSETSLRRIADVTGTIDFPPERAIVLQGQVGNGLYLLVSGRARALQGETVLAEFGPGDFFGELSVIDQQPRTATVVALEPTVCLGLASWDLLAVRVRPAARAQPRPRARPPPPVMRRAASALNRHDVARGG
jgi:CRP-like cAMP-binding protein